MKRILLGALGFLAAVSAGAQDDKSGGKTATLEETLAWLKRLDTDPASAQKQPRFPSLTVDDLKTLKAIRLGGHRSSDNKHVYIEAAEFRFFAALPAIENANLVEIDGFTDDALAQVCKVATITELNLGDAGVTNAGLPQLARLKNLRRLDLGWTKDVGDSGLPHLSQLGKLEILGLGGTKVTDAGLPALSKLPRLKELYLPATAVTDSGLQTLATFKGLTLVRLNSKMNVTPKGIDAFKKALPGCKVEMK